MTQKITIRKAERGDIPLLLELVQKLKHSKRDGYFEHAFEIGREVFIAAYEGVLAGYCLLAWEPKYAFFLKMGFPEIQDLNVVHDYRRRGIASAMITHCEDLARKAGKTHMGIGVGMDASYGPAQILYAHAGYIPDGNGVTYDRKPITHGEMRPVDDEMSLMLVKNL